MRKPHINSKTFELNRFENIITTVNIPKAYRTTQAAFKGNSRHSQLKNCVNEWYPFFLGLYTKVPILPRMITITKNLLTNIPKARLHQG